MRILCLSVFSDNDTTIYLQEEAVWKKVKLFENHTEIMIAGRFVSDHLYYIFIGNVSSAEEENFATLALRPRGEKFMKIICLLLFVNLKK